MKIKTEYQLKEEHEIIPDCYYKVEDKIYKYVNRTQLSIGLVGIFDKVKAKTDIDTSDEIFVNSKRKFYEIPTL